MRLIPLPFDPAMALRGNGWVRVLFGHRIMNGLGVGVGLALTFGLLYLTLGEEIAAIASVGSLIASIGDQTAPARSKWRQVTPLLWMAMPLSLATQLLRLLPEHADLWVGVLVSLGGFVGMLGNAWGARGAPLGFALLLTIVFGLSAPPPPNVPTALLHAFWFEVGALLYGGYAIVEARVLDLRYRTQALADALAEMGTMLHQQAARLDVASDRRESRVQALLDEQAALADKLQTARDLVLDKAEGARAQRLAGMLIAAIHLREHALACELELDMQPSRHREPIDAQQAQALEELWREMADNIARVCWSLFLGERLPSDFAAPFEAHRASSWKQLAATLPPALSTAVEAMTRELHQLLRLAHADPAAPPGWSATEARGWPRFRTSMRWPMAPLVRSFRGHSPVLRYALRVAIGLAAGYIVALHLPWAAHPHWILLTIAVVMRANLQQTLERRNARLVGTLAGCLLAALLLSLHPPVPLQMAMLAVGAGLAHGFAQVRYLFAATSATVMALLQGQLLHTATQFALVERLADTLIGTLLAWGFSYVLPAWERRQLPALITRLRKAQVSHATIALAGDDLAVGNADWRLARREVHDSIAALALAAQRALVEPSEVQPPLGLLERIQLRSYRLLAQLGGVRIWREQPQTLAAGERDAMLTAGLERILAALKAKSGDAADASPDHVRALSETLSPSEEDGLLQQRLHDAAVEAAALGADLDRAHDWEMTRRDAGRGAPA
jgi:uncharacterized membrane protein YccC